MPITDFDRAMALIKFATIMNILQTQGFGNNLTTRLAVRLMARVVDMNTSTTDEQFAAELEFIIADEELHHG